jgi:outer membrane protein W
LGGGIGYYINDTEINDKGKDAIREERLTDPTYNLSADLENAYGGQIALGGDYFLSRNTAINLDLRYFWAWSFVTVKVTEAGESTVIKDKFDLDSAVASVGIKYLF